MSPRVAASPVHGLPPIQCDTCFMARSPRSCSPVLPVGACPLGPGASRGCRSMNLRVPHCVCTQFRVHFRHGRQPDSTERPGCRAHFAEVIARAQDGSPTVITRNGQAVAAVVPIEDFSALEDAIDRYFAREADRDLEQNPGAPTYSMSEVVAAIFEEEPGQGVA